MARFNWLNPLARSYGNIKQELIAKLKVYNPEVTDLSPGNIFSILLNFMAGIGESLHYYIDNMARETFFTSARRLSSIVNHSKLVGYRIPGSNAASVDLLLYQDVLNHQDLTITPDAENGFIEYNGLKWYFNRTYIWPSEEIRTTVTVVEYSIHENVQVGVISLGANIIVPIQRYYVDQSMSLVLNAGTDNQEQWELVESFSQAAFNDKVFMVDIQLENPKQVRILFGDGTFGELPKEGSTVTVSFKETGGTSSNIEAESITTDILPQYIIDAIPGVKVSQRRAASGGTNQPDINFLRGRVPLSLQILGVAVTEDDYERLAKLINPAIKEAVVDYNCTRYLEIYISGYTPAEFSTGEKENLKQALNKHKVLTTTIVVKDIDRSKIYLEITVKAKKSISSILCERQVRAELQTQLSWNNSSIGKAIRVSDIYALIDGLSTVDYVNIDYLWVVPTIRDISAQNSTVLDYDMSEPTLVPGVNLLNINVSVLVINATTGESVLTFTETRVNEDGSEYVVPSFQNYPIPETPDESTEMLLVDTDGNTIKFKLNSIRSEIPTTFQGRYTISRPNVDQVVPIDLVAYLENPSDLVITVEEQV